VSLRIAKLLPALICCSCSFTFGQRPVRYTVSLADPDRHLVRVELALPPGPPSHELQLPVWNALYQVRDFVQYMNWIRAEDASGHALQLTQLNKSRWQVTGSERGARIEYEMFSDTPGPYGAQLNSHHAFFNLAEILLYADDARAAPVQVEFQRIPANWKIATPLRPDGAAYAAANYDQLVDSPVEIGKFTESDFNGRCGKYRVAFDGENATSILEKIIPPIERIVAGATQWMNDCPFQDYLFIYHVSDWADGGMEHAFGTAINLPTVDFGKDLGRFIAITTHEFFHLWDVKRIRPQSLEPIDYTKENYTPALWFSEGVDTTAAEQIELRAGLLDERHFLDQLGQQITELENRPAHLTQSVEQSSLDAWLEKYPRYGLPERSISYYNKGELLGVLLDLAMRDASQDHASLRELFRWMNDQYAKQGKFFADSEAVRQAAESLSHADLRDFFRQHVGGAGEILWDNFFASVGLRVNRLQAVFADAGFEAVQKFDQPPIVVQVQARSEAERAGLKLQDEILQINGQQPGRNFEAQIAGFASGSNLTLLVRREGAQHRLQWKLGSREQTIFQLMDLPQVTAQQKGRRAAWLFDGSDNKPR
jgi:predicted metalloprotease with PDZ domain